jgi:hypothetical protein
VRIGSERNRSEKAMIEAVRAKIADVIRRRQEHLPDVEHRLAIWQELDDRLAGLEAALSELASHPSTPEEIRGVVADFMQRNVRGGIPLTMQRLRVVQARMSRPTVNIGVSGQARVGKSQFLQTVSGLEEEQIPTGADVPVTAVRSRIYHIDRPARAAVVLHTFDSFRTEVLEPYHRKLGLPPPPENPNGFRSMPYQESPDWDPEQRGLFRRLREMQVAFPHYESLLRGGEQDVHPLSRLREYIAYPTAAAQASNPERLYLAVREARIECKFPRVEVENLALTDLPGLGELAAEVEGHHVDGLRNEIDLVLLIKRPMEGAAFWTAADGRALTLLDQSRGAVKRSGDFVFIVNNQGGCSPSRVTAMLGEIRQSANDGQDGKHYQVLSCDAKDQASVFSDVIQPVLEHLSTRLAVMDAEVLADANEQARLTAQPLKAIIADLLSELRTYIGPNASEKLDQLIEQLHDGVAIELRKLLDELESETRSEERDAQLVDAVVTAFDRAVDGVDRGFGEGQEAWLQTVTNTMIRDRGCGRAVDRELNRARVFVSDQYAGIDVYLESRVARLWDDVATILNHHLGDLLGGATGKEALALFAAKLREAEPACDVLASAVDDLLGLELRYWNQFHPRVRSKLSPLEPIRRLGGGKVEPQVVVSPDAIGARALHKRLNDLVELAAYGIRMALLDESAQPARVLHAATERFDDSFIRSGGAETEFTRLGRSYKVDVWPQEFNNIDAENARIARVRRSANAVLQTLTELAE